MRPFRIVLLVICACAVIILTDRLSAEAQGWIWVAPPWDEEMAAGWSKFINLMMELRLKMPEQEAKNTIRHVGPNSGLSPRVIERMIALFDRLNDHFNRKEPGAWFQTLYEGMLQTDAPLPRWQQFMGFDSASACERARLTGRQTALDQIRRSVQELDAELAGQPLDRWARVSDEATTTLGKNIAVRESRCVPAAAMYPTQ